MSDRRAADPSAWDVLERWRKLRSDPAGEDAPLTDRTKRDFVADLIASHLDSYAYERLSTVDREWWEERWNDDEEAGAFSRLFGPEWIVTCMDDFLGWFVIRKVASSPSDNGVYASLCAELIEWMAMEGLTRGDEASPALDRAHRATEELPLAGELGELLYLSSETFEDEGVEATIDWIDEMATITRVEPGALWLRGESGEEVGPVRVPERAAEIARLGWQVSAASFGQAPDGWHLLEMGNVYPG
jgi:hypothetical protein